METNGLKRMLKINAMLSSLVAVCCLGLASPAQAAQITGINLQKAPGGDVVTIRADKPPTYEVFDLSAPPRLVLSLPGFSLKQGLEPLHSDRPGVNSVFPVKSGNSVRLEIGMDKALAYKIDEQGKNLVIRFAAASKQGRAGKDGSAAVLKDLDIRDRGPMTELILRGEHMDASHDAFVTNHGRTLILDFWGATSKLAREHYSASTQKVRGVTVGHAKQRVRVVVDLVPGAREQHQIEASNSQLIVRFGEVRPARKAAAVRVEDVHFQPNDRVAHLMIRTDVTNPIVNVYEKKGNVVMDVQKAVLAPGQERTQDVRDFPGPVKQVDAYKAGNLVRIVARLREKVDVSTFQQGNVVTLTLAPKGLAAAQRGERAIARSRYIGEKVTFDFKDIDIRNALKLIAEMSKLNIIMSDDVSGTLTMRLVDVPWDQALDLILAGKGLGKDQIGNVVRVAPLEVLRKEKEVKLESRKGQQELEPLITEAISLNYAKVKDIKKMLDESKSAAAKAGGKKEAGQALGLMSSRGSYLVDERTNTLIVTDTRQAIDNIKRLIVKIDTPVPQVLIASRIVEATNDFTRQLGVRWGGQFQSARVGQNGDQNLQVGSAAGVTPTGTRGFLVDLPAAAAIGSGGAIGLSYSAISKALNLDLELSAAEIDGKAKIISNPRIVTANGVAAEIAQGQDVPFVTPASANSPATVQFKKAELKLNVTPQITARKSVILNVDITKDATTGTEVLGNPILSTKRVQTSLEVDNGGTVVIGGIYSRTVSRNESGVPFFKDIPILGWLFKTKSHDDKKSELLVFLTPRILEGTAAQTKVVTRTP